MKEFTYVIQDKDGIHARPAGILVKEATAFKSGMTIYKDEKQGNLKGILGIMSLGVKQGDEVRIRIEGEDEEAAVKIMEDVFKENL
ncbi:MAG: HPr family phosphocarrier protein [Clostridia bacterium]|nr:HPr family phosphocarrier protein [Lachnospiraceae bacterium]NCB99762.1 HPr family phosphocarrier protein [Clostridia bacterium]NCD03889.1 HPr family phosphocarrier protein [Clostridia bacterium]